MMEIFLSKKQKCLKYSYAGILKHGCPEWNLLSKWKDGKMVFQEMGAICTHFFYRENIYSYSDHININPYILVYDQDFTRMLC